MRAVFAGVRGSTPAPGHAFADVGGNTSCVVIHADDDGPPRLVLDAGTGIRSVSSMLGGKPFVGSILLSHLHWDHVQGLPFFAAADRDDASVRLLLPDDGIDAATSLARAMSPPHFPIGPDGLRGSWSFHNVDEGVHDIEGFLVTAVEIPHKGGRTFGYRIEAGDRSIAYVPDHLFDPAVAGGVRRLVTCVDLLIHDAQFTEAERALATAYGHSTVKDAVRLAESAGALTLVLFHHSPTRTDDQLRELHASIESPIRVLLATEGEEVGVAGGRALSL